MKNVIYSIVGLLFLLNTSANGQNPVADFKANYTRVCVGNTVTFSDSTTNSPTSWSWTFTGGTPNNSNVQKPAIKYNTVGLYDVSLTATNANGNDSETKSNYINVVLCKPSKGIYRIPYVNGTQINIGNDHLRHAPVNNRIDMNGINGGPYTIVAAEDGVIKYIEESNTDSQGSCDNNNYVWIEHPNGEWTKYSHMATNSTSNAGRFVGQTVCAGTVLGIESDIGCASNDHLHFEVGIPDDLSDPINEVGGFLKGPNLIPVICDINNNKFFEGAMYTAANCSTDCLNNFVGDLGTYNAPAAIIIPVDNTIVTPDGVGSSVFNSGATAVFRAENIISLKPGFQAKKGSYFWATIRDCNSSPGLISCNLMMLQDPNTLKKN